MMTERNEIVLKILSGLNEKTAISTQQIFCRLSEQHQQLISNKTKLSAQLTKMRDKQWIGNGISDYEGGLALLTWHITEQGQSMLDNESQTFIDEMIEPTQLQGTDTKKIDIKEIQLELKKFLDSYFNAVNVPIDILGEKTKTLQLLIDSPIINEYTTDILIQIKEDLTELNQ